MKRKNNKSIKICANVKGNDKKQLVLQIIKSDLTFKFHTCRDGERWWVGRCMCCDACMTILPNGETNFVITYIKPRYANGTNELRNLILVCGGCDIEKERKAAEFVNLIQEKRISRWRGDPL